MSKLNPITIDNSGNYPTIIGAGYIGELANARISEYWVHSGSNSFPPPNQVLLDILIEDFNKRNPKPNDPVSNLEGRDGKA